MQPGAAENAINHVLDDVLVDQLGNELLTVYTTLVQSGARVGPDLPDAERHRTLSAGQWRLRERAQVHGVALALMGFWSAASRSV